MKLLISLTLGCLALAGTVLRPYQAPLGITVRVLDRAPVPARLTAEAERLAALIFQKAGVSVQWVDCNAPGACRAEAGNLEIRLQIMDGRPAALSGDALGFAVLTHERGNGAGYAAVSWQAVREASEGMEGDPGPMLGAAMAHELGHLLLDSQAHSSDGVMAARLGPSQLARAARGELRFDPDHAAQIRRAIRRRSE